MPKLSQHERVLCVPTKSVRELTKARKEAFIVGFRGLTQLLSNIDASFVARSDCENNPEYKQISLYSIFRYNFSVFAYRRGKSGGDSRLHSKWSVGVGGHASEEGLGGDKFLKSGAIDRLSLIESEVMREINEEIRLDAIPSTVIRAGLINHEDGEIGDYHIGIVHLWQLSAPKITVREDCLADPQWINLNNGERAQFEANNTWEGWSRIAIDNIGRFVT